MPEYDFLRKNKKLETYRDTACFSEVWNNIQLGERISIYVTPDNYYGDKILEEYTTPEELGVERWAQALAFIPGTSFVADYKEMEKPLQYKFNIAEFRFEKIEETHVSPVMRQLWINGVRYAWELPFTILPRFVLTYFKPEMTKLEKFNLHLLAHYTIEDRLNGHSSKVVASKIYTQEKYEELLVVKSTGSPGTACMTNNRKRDPVTYEFIKTPIANIVKETSRKIQAEKKQLTPGKDVPTLEEILDVWKKE